MIGYGEYKQKTPSNAWAQPPRRDTACRVRKKLTQTLANIKNIYYLCNVNEPTRRDER